MNEPQSFERRGATRFHTLNLLSYVETNPDGQMISQGIAKTLDLSSSGALIVIPEKFLHPEYVQFEIALDEDIIKIAPDIVLQEKLEDNGFQVRVQFKKLRPAEKHRLERFILSIKSTNNTI